MTTKAKNKATTSVEVVNKQRRKNPPRTAFKKGGPNPHAFKPGHTTNPGGKVRATDALMSKSLRVALADRAPDEVCRRLALPTHRSWGQVLAHRLILLALSGDMQAMREIREATEGAHSRLDLHGLEALNRDPSKMPPIFELVFVESDGNGRLPSGVTIQGRAGLTAPLD